MINVASVLNDLAELSPEQLTQVNRIIRATKERDAAKLREACATLNESEMAERLIARWGAA